MDENRQNAYRFLLYWATLDIRPLLSFPHWKWCGLNPSRWQRQFRRVRLCGAIAEWLHNMAQYSGNSFGSGNGFKQFDEQRFWREHERLCQHYPEAGMERYQDLFERRLTELQTGKWPNPD